MKKSNLDRKDPLIKAVRRLALRDGDVVVINFKPDLSLAQRDQVQHTVLAIAREKNLEIGVLMLPETVKLATVLHAKDK